MNFRSIIIITSLLLSANAFSQQRDSLSFTYNEKTEDYTYRINDTLRFTFNKNHSFINHFNYNLDTVSYYEEYMFDTTVFKTGNLTLTLINQLVSEQSIVLEIKSPEKMVRLIKENKNGYTIERFYNDNWCVKTRYGKNGRRINVAKGTLYNNKFTIATYAFYYKNGNVSAYIIKSGAYRFFVTKFKRKEAGVAKKAQWECNPFDEYD